MEEKAYAPRSTSLVDVFGTSIDEQDGLQSRLTFGKPVIVEYHTGQFYYGDKLLTSSLVTELQLEVVSSVSEIYESEREA